MTAFNETLLLHAGSARTDGAPPVPPIVAASIFASSGEPDPARAYGRNGNPTWEALEDVLGAIEDARALVFASGQAASMALMLALTEGRRRLVIPADGYYNTRTLADRLRPNGVEPIYVDLQDLAAVERELAAEPAVLWAETPTNPLLRVADLARLGELAAAAGAPMAVDNTVATAALQQPLSWGATASLYSLTKAASGHADVILGATVTRDEGLLESLRGWRDTAGGVAGPFEAWLALRGLRTLHLRVDRAESNATELARRLGEHSATAEVRYPGFGGIVSVVLTGGTDAADLLTRSTSLWVHATSLGGVESTLERRRRWKSEPATIPDGLVRLSVGIEDVDDLWTDLANALGGSA